MTTHAWLPHSGCSAACLPDAAARRGLGALRVALRFPALLAVLSAFALLVVPVPGRPALQRALCRALLRCLGIRVAVTGGPVRNVAGVLVVSDHVSWVDAVVIAAVMPGTFVARADLLTWPALGALARRTGVIPIDRASLRGLPAVVTAVAARLGAGRTVVAFPEGTTWCGRSRGTFAPAMFQAAIDAGRPVQPLRLAYRDGAGAASTVPAFVGDDTLLRSVLRTIRAGRTVAELEVASLQLPGADRRNLAARCQREVRGPVASRRVTGSAVAA
ncbi:1-acyl-sn-glycerol-3-phosphate acyltransferase [Mycobacterium sp. MYCO198283]|uniref:lysophospholipid acyltransferase family protein n=1 Tax=Mycobacterium sp. MYCO198283 TaxID=2883505 RepID=UPI001E474106|nr:lysophospholipid acyltransferase family protein [Mycobacterium sp. MYCO198283]MCG5434370.1 1-acyl-sn-glycerol-3-phosphate acyltransferase [Mycobacterium sp. MYCO198283]